MYHVKNLQPLATCVLYCKKSSVSSTHSTQRVDFCVFLTHLPTAIASVLDCRGFFSLYMMFSKVLLLERVLMVCLQICKRRSKAVNTKSPGPPMSTGKASKTSQRHYKHLTLLPFSAIKRVVDICETPGKSHNIALHQFSNITSWLCCNDHV